MEIYYRIRALCGYAYVRPLRSAEFQEFFAECVRQLK